jgi:hypothetical protein
MDMPTITSRALSIALLAVATLYPGVLDAQERGAGGRGRNGVAVLPDPMASTVSQMTICLRIHPKTPDEATALKTSLTRHPGVSEVKMSEDLRTVSLSYQGVYGDLPKLESKVSGSLLNPAKLELTVARTPGKEKCRTCGLEEHLRGVAGVSSGVLKGSRAELYVDLELLDPRKLAAAADSAGYRVEIQSHAWWTVKLDGNAPGMPETFGDMRGILKIERAGSDVKLVALRTLTGDALVSVAQKAGLKATPTLVSP